MKVIVNIIKSGYLERTSCFSRGSGFQPRSSNFAAGSRSHSGLLYDNLDFSDKRLIKFIIFLLLLLLLGCAQKQPVLYPNSHLKNVGKEAAQADIQDCIQLAKDYGTDTDKGNEIVKSSAKGAAVGAAGGAAVGAVTGKVGRGVAAGAAGGAAVGGTRKALDSGDPNPVFKRFVEKCLRDRGYHPIGWK